MKQKIWILLIGIVVASISACAIAPVGDVSEKTAGDKVSAQNVTLWEPMDSYNTAIWQESNWANGGMFNCGWSPDHISFANSVMTIKLDNVSTFGKPYTSGEYSTLATYSYGTFEVNMKSASASGIVSSFFTYTGSPWDEIDCEILGKNTSQIQFNFFVGGVGGHEHVYNLGFDSSLLYHKYKIEYGNGYINWYVDGTWVWGVNNTGLNLPNGAALPSHAQKIYMNLWPGTGVDSWLGAFSYSGPLYAYYDYVNYVGF